MKHKIRFPGMLMPFRKQKSQPEYNLNRSKSSYALALFLLWLFVFLCVCIKGKCQQLLPLHPGERLPEVTYNFLQHGRSKTGSTGAFQNQLIILDFWATSCGSCLESLPKLSALQKQFGDSILILCVDYEKPELVKSALRRREGQPGTELPFVTQDKALSALFPHRYLPFVVWIYKGVYLHATDGDYLNADNIRALLQGQAGHFNQKTHLAGFDYRQPLTTLRPEAGLSSRLPLFGSTLTGHIPGLGTPGGNVVDSASHTRRYYLINQPVLNLYGVALRSPFPLRPNRRILEVRNAAAYVYDPSQGYRDEWSRDHTYTFEARLRADASDTLMRLQLLNLLQQSLALNGRIEQKIIPAYRLVDKRASAAHAASDILPENSTSELIRLLNQTSGLPPVADARPTGSADPTFSKVPQDLAAWQAALARHSLALIPCQLTLPVFVLTETGPPPVFTP